MEIGRYRTHRRTRPGVGGNYARSRHIHPPRMSRSVKRTPCSIAPCRPSCQYMLVYPRCARLSGQPTQLGNSERNGTVIGIWWQGSVPLQQKTRRRLHRNHLRVHHRPSNSSRHSYRKGDSAAGSPYRTRCTCTAARSLRRDSAPLSAITFTAYSTVAPSGAPSTNELAARSFTTAIIVGGIPSAPR